MGKYFNPKIKLKIVSLRNLTLPVPIPDEEKKVTEIFIFTLLFGVLNFTVVKW